MYKAKEIVENYRSQILRSNERAIAALMKVYKNQLRDEKRSYSSVYLNNKGFNKQDAKSLTEIAHLVLLHKELTEGQLSYVREKMAKYSRQLFRISLETHVIEKVGRNQYIVSLK